ncbi:MAG: magnesium transporter CorA family protein [Xylophilus ampelinus]
MAAPPRMRVFHFHGGRIDELDRPPAAPPAQGFLWVSCARQEFAAALPALQESFQALGGCALVDLHVSDLLNEHLPSHYDYTSRYDLLVFRRLTSALAARGRAAAREEARAAQLRQGTQSEASGRQGSAVQASGTATAPPPSGSGPAAAPATAAAAARTGDDGPARLPPGLRQIDTSPVGFAAFDRLLLSIHPADCQERDAFAARLLQTFGGPAAAPAGHAAGGGSRPPAGPADLMLRLINAMVDGYLDLRRLLTRQFEHWQGALLQPSARFVNWSALLDARLLLHHLDEVCDDQRSAVQDWIDALETLPVDAPAARQRDHELLAVRARDVLEHIDRVVHHVRRMEQNTETAVQMHFNVQSNRTNDIMRILTAVTAVFLPLNLIAGIFGMNFEWIPLIHRQSGFWWALAAMGLTAVLLLLYFWRKRYLARPER